MRLAQGHNTENAFYEKLQALSKFGILVSFSVNGVPISIKYCLLT